MKTSPQPWDRLEEWMQYLADADTEWWPFLSLRPAQHERIGNARCLAMAALYAVPASLAVVLIGLALGERVPAQRLFIMTSVTTALVFALLRLGMVNAWNRRAKQLSAARRRRQLWQRG